MSDVSTAPSPSLLPEAHELARGLGLLVHNTLNHHWFSSTDERETLVSFYALVSGCLTRGNELVFRLVGDALTVNGVPPKEEERYITTLIEQMTALDVGNFVLRRGITVEELAAAVHLLTQEPEVLLQAGGFASALAGRGAGHVSSKTIVYREVADDEVVLQRKDVEAAQQGASSVESAARAAREAEALALLQAPSAAPAPAPAADAVRAVAGDAPRMAELIVEAARLRVAPDGSLAGELVACVRKVFEALTQGDALETQRGRKQIQKQLRELEESLLGLLDRVTGYDPAKNVAAVRAVVADLEDDLQIDALAAEYAKRLKAMEQTEKRLLRYMKAHGGEAPAESGLGERLLEEGVAPDRWGALLAQSGDPAVAAAHLGPLLDRMERAAGELTKQPDGNRQGQLDRVLTEVQTQVGVLVEHTAQKIKRVTADIQADRQAAEEADEAARRQGIGLKFSRRKLLELLAEVVQELCQPLAVINCSVDMIQSNMLGDVAPTQREMLKLVAESSAKLQDLVNGLQKIAGVPDTMSPDRELLKQVISS
ncbi:MAG: hypothetical protein K8T26_10450 [Lentisphaerae bacterium]|nr:hypothetical protein [Lentisphaerota bacterium]